MNGLHCIPGRRLMKAHSLERARIYPCHKSRNIRPALAAEGGFKLCQQSKSRRGAAKCYRNRTFIRSSPTRPIELRPAMNARWPACKAPVPIHSPSFWRMGGKPQLSTSLVHRERRKPRFLRLAESKACPERSRMGICGCTSANFRLTTLERLAARVGDRETWERWTKEPCLPIISRFRRTIGIDWLRTGFVGMRTIAFEGETCEQSPQCRMEIPLEPQICAATPLPRLFCL
jgi:hypothetical protein